MTTRRTEDFSYSLSSDALPESSTSSAYFHVKIGALEGRRDQAPALQLLDDPLLKYSGRAQGPDQNHFYVTCQLFADARPVVPLSIDGIRTQYSRGTVWNEWVWMPVKYQELAASSVICFTVWECMYNRDADGQVKAVKHAVAGSTFDLFGSDMTLKRGSYRVYLHLDKQAALDGSTSSKLAQPRLTTELDRLEKLLKSYHRGDMQKVEWLDRMSLKHIEDLRKQEAESCQTLSLTVELADCDFPLIYHEQLYEHIIVKKQPFKICKMQDPDMNRENLVEAKHRRLVRSHRSGPIDRELKPNAKLRDELNLICRYPSTQALTKQECDLLWKFRFYLSRDKTALTKFLKAVDWNDSAETKQATEILMPIWMEIDVDDALELLGPTFTNRQVRHYAVQQLEKADDSELQLYLLQLVQAIKFESLIDRGAYESSLVEFLTSRAINNPVLGSSFHWYLMTECEDKMYAKMYAKVAYHFMSRMVESPNGAHRRDLLRRQGELIERFCNINRELTAMKESRPKKIEWLRAYIADYKNGLCQFASLPLPLDANVLVEGVIAEKATVFKSQLSPMLISFRCTNRAEYTVLFKLGDDLRQDQLVMQVITLMDRLLRKENLDLKLTPYSVLATGSDHGLIQFIPSSAMASVLAQYNGNIQSYLREMAPDPSATESYGIDPAVMDNYVKSCAGYCVITYLLGIGDRHLDNLLLTPQGNLFHIDFGYILSRDPKPFPPPMKLCKEMVDAMGGTGSLHYQKFQSLCYTAFMILRKSSNLILNLFALMIDANIPDIRLEPDKAVMKVQEKFRLDLSDEEAIQYFQQLINESVNALFPQLMETVHKWAQYWRK